MVIQTVASEAMHALASQAVHLLHMHIVDAEEPEMSDESCSQRATSFLPTQMFSLNTERRRVTSCTTIIIQTLSTLTSLVFFLQLQIKINHKINLL